MEMKRSKSNASFGVRDIVQVGLLAALTYVATAVINVPNGYGGVIHLGDSMVFLAAILFGRRTGALSGAIGMTLFDLLSPYAEWAPFTLVIKAGMAIIVGTIAYSGGAKGESMVRNIVGMVLAGIWMIAGYYAAEAILYSNILAPLQSILGNVIQATAGTVIATVLLAAVKKTNYFKNK